MAIELKLPEVGEGISAGTVVSVLVKVGDSIEENQGVVELETDKAVVEVPADAAGVVKEIRVQENQEAKVGDVILILDEDSSAAAKEEQAADEQIAAEGEASAPAVAKEQAVTPQETSSAPTAPTTTASDAKASSSSAGTEDNLEDNSADSEDGATIPAAPSVRRLARELGVKLADVQGSGLLGRISAADVQKVAAGEGAPAAPTAAAPTAAPLPDFSKYGSVKRESMNGIRKATVRSMANAWSTVPMVTQFDKANTAEFDALRKRYKARAEAAGTKLTPTAVLLKMVVGALKSFPKFNASLDVANQEVIYKDYINITVAVDTPNGLMVPVIKDVDKKGIILLSKELGDIAQKARDRKLTPEDMQGGNFSISNLGGIGGTGFTPIVAPPEVAILGVSRSSIEPVWDDDAGEFRPKSMMPLSLSYDHRLIDGADAARFLRFLCATIEDPHLMSIDG